MAFKEKRKVTQILLKHTKTIKRHPELKSSVAHQLEWAESKGVEDSYMGETKFVRLKKSF